jgi:hypothetical protein
LRKKVVFLFICSFVSSILEGKFIYFFMGKFYGVWGLGFGVWGLGFGVWGLGFGV